jgi:predicted Rossmann fold nucleotide-binding protein DprA/Smf involved in DNA uptake
MNNEVIYWMSLANLPKWGPKKTIGLIIKFYHENKLSAENFFQLSPEDLKKGYELVATEVEDLLKAREELANQAFLAETLMNEGYEIIPVISEEYPRTLKENLKTQAPVVVYVKGNKQILRENAIAIVGSRNAADISLQFTDNITKLASKQYKVVVSGFAKGVDKQALDSSLKYKGQSIIVLPQGIMTFGTGFKKYYRQIVDGDLLVLSTFHPKAHWKVELAMARNPVIYGLASEIYVAESSDKGGTWAGVIDGLRKNRKIFVRRPEKGEKNANDLLIQKGAVPVDFNGISLDGYTPAETQALLTTVQENTPKYEDRILELLKFGEYPVKEIIKRLKLEISEKQLRDYLKSHREVATLNKNSLKFTLKNKGGQGELF